MASRLAPLKSKLQPCSSAYRWLPQNVFPHRHMNPVSPTFLQHAAHRPGGAFFFAAASGAGGGDTAAASATAPLAAGANKQMLAVGAGATSTVGLAAAVEQPAAVSDPGVTAVAVDRATGSNPIAAPEEAPGPSIMV